MSADMDDMPIDPVELPEPEFVRDKAIADTLAKIIAAESEFKHLATPPPASADAPADAAAKIREELRGYVDLLATYTVKPGAEEFDARPLRDLLRDALTEIDRLHSLAKSNNQLARIFGNAMREARSKLANIRGDHSSW